MDPARHKHETLKGQFVWLRVALIGSCVLVGWWLRAPFLDQPAHSDILWYSQWTWRMLAHGPGAAYGKGGMYVVHRDQRVRLPPCNNPVGHCAIFYGIGRWFYPLAADEPFTLDLALTLNDPPETADKRLARWLFKLPAVVADLLTVALVGWWCSRRWGTGHGVLVALMLAVHPAIIYDSSVWGQIDAWHTLAMTVTVLLLCLQRWRAATVALTVAMLFKLQAVVLAPLVGLCLLAANREQTTGRIAWPPVRQTLALAGLLVVAAWLPWLATGAGRHLLDPYTRVLGQCHYATVNAFNLYWPLTDWPDARAIDFTDGIDDRQPVVGLAGTGFSLSYRMLGTFLALGTMAWICWRVWQRRLATMGIQWAALTLTLAFFCLATEMHERYLLPVIPLLAIAYRPDWRWWLLWLATGVAVTVNLACFFPAPTGSWLAHLTAWTRADVVMVGNVTSVGLLGLLLVLLVSPRSLVAETRIGSRG